MTATVLEAPPSLTVGAVIRSYLDQKTIEYHDGVIVKSSYDRLIRYLGSFGKMYGHQVMERCRRSDPVTWIAAHPTWRSPHTRLDALGAVVACFRWAENEPLIEKSPYRRPAKQWANPKPRAAITEAEYLAVMQEAKKYRCISTKLRGRPSRFAFRRTLWFLWQTGARTCESREADWSQLDWECGALMMTDHKTSKITATDRLIPLSKLALRYLRWLWRSRGCPEHGIIFLNGRGRPWTRVTFGKHFRAYAERAGVRDEVSAYSLRHGFCCRALEAGVGERQVADLMGHSSCRYISYYGRSLRGKVSYLRASLGQIGIRRKHE